MDFAKTVISDFITVVVECVAVFLAFLVPVLICVFLLTLPLDLIVWLIGKADSWPHTAFVAPLLSAAALVFVRGLVLCADTALGVVFRKFPGLHPKQATVFTPVDGTKLHYIWANRLPPYDK
jgi:hypothetical protein